MNIDELTDEQLDSWDTRSKGWDKVAICKTCKTTFQRLRVNHDYCSKTCRREAENRQRRQREQTALESFLDALSKQ